MSVMTTDGWRGSAHVDPAAAIKVEAIEALLESVAAEYRLSTFIYCVVGPVHLPSWNGEEFHLSACSGKWLVRSLDRQWPRLKPAFRGTFSGGLPVDWGALKIGQPTIAGLFGSPFAHQCGKYGTLFPITGRRGEKAVMIVTGSDPCLGLDDMDLPTKRDFQVLSYHLHEKVNDIRGLKQEDVHLSKREIECLCYVAQGYTMGQVGTSLSLTERTVRFYLDTARVKLGAANVSHAVAKSIGFGLIY